MTLVWCIVLLFTCLIFLSYMCLYTTALKYSICKNNKCKRLKFHDDGTFKISHLTDLHYGEKIELDNKNDQFITNLINWENPDFVAVTGDVVSGMVWDKVTRPFLEPNYRKFLNTMTNSKKLYAVSIGNHDSDGDLTKLEVIQLDMTNPYSLTKIGPKDTTGITNYYIPIYNSKESEIEYIMWFFGVSDKNRTISWWEWIGNDTVKWYEKESKKLKQKYNRIIPGVIFVHVPPVEFLTTVHNKEIYGIQGEDICCPTLDAHLLDSVVRQDNIQGIFVGHDHDNDFYLKYNDKIRLHYDRKSGYGCYGPKNMSVGSTTIILNSKFHNYTFYVRDDKGEVITNYKPSIGRRSQKVCPFPWKKI